MRKIMDLALVCCFGLCLTSAAVCANGTEDKAAEDKTVAAIKKVCASAACLNGECGLFIRDEKAPGKPVIGVDLSIATGWRGAGDSYAALVEVKKLKNLRTLNISRNAVSAKGLAELKGVTTLTALYLSQSTVTDEGLSHLNDIKSLQTLNLADNPITDAGMKYLKDLQNLQSLNLSYQSVNDPVRRINVFTDAGLAELKELKHLESLDLSGNPDITGAGLAGFKGLRTLNLGFSGAADAGMKGLANLKDLETLNLRDTKVTDAGLQRFVLQRRLQPIAPVQPKRLAQLIANLGNSSFVVRDKATLELTELAESVEPQLRESLKSPPSLEAKCRVEKILEGLQAGALTAGQLRGIRSNPVLTHMELKNLQTLDLGGTQVTDAGLVELKNLPSLKSLNLLKTRVTDAGAKELKNVRSLELVNLWGTEITEAGMNDLKKLKGLLGADAPKSAPALGENRRRFPLGVLVVDPAGQMNLKAIQSVETLDFSFGGGIVTDVWLNQVRAFKNLRTLHLDGSAFTEKGLAELKGLANLQSLSLGGNYMISDAALMEIKELKNLQHLNLGFAGGITDAGLKELKKLQNLKTLNLDASEITDAGLAELKELKSLESLNLAITNITGTGLIELKELKNLQDLDLRESRQVTDAAMKAVKELKSLRTLNLTFAQVTDTGLQELKELKNLRSLILDSTKVTAKGIQELYAALPELTIYNGPPVPRAPDAKDKGAEGKALPKDRIYR